MDKTLLLHKNKQYDLTIIGAGIYGSWCAYHAARAGLKVLVVDSGDIAGQTSMSSSKLIHGGLRYLEHFHLGLVSTALKERRELTTIAPHLIQPLRFIVPTTVHSRVGPWKLRAGMWLYDQLAGPNQPVEPHTKLTQQEREKDAPYFNEKVSHLLSYGDCQTDDARFCLDVCLEAITKGADVLTYCHAGEVLKKEDSYTVELSMNNGKETGRISTRTLLHCTGTGLQKEPELESKLRYTKGIHLSLPALPTQDALLLQAPQDGRFFFAIPWYNRTLLGTTDTDENELSPSPTIDEPDIEYLLKAVNSYLKDDFHLSKKDIYGAFAGMRVMQKSPRARTPSSNTREWECCTLEEGRWASVGGKFTSSRIDSHEIIAKICTYLNVPYSLKSDALASTPKLPFSQWLSSFITQAEKLSLDNECAQALARRYGQKAESLLQIIQETPNLAHRITPDLTFIMAEIPYCCSHENVTHLIDLLRRRIPLIILQPFQEDLLQKCASLAAIHLEWSTETIEQELKECTLKWQEASLILS